MYIVYFSYNAIRRLCRISDMRAQLVESFTKHAISEQLYKMHVAWS